MRTNRSPLWPVLAATIGGFVVPVAAQQPPGRPTVVASNKLPNVPGKSLTAVLVRYAPGEAWDRTITPAAFRLVLSGAIRSEVSTSGPAKVYQAGESFFEPPGSDHLVSANASTTEPASLLAIFVADDGAVLTTPDK